MTSSSGTEADARPRAVDLEPAADHDVLEVAGARGRAHRRDRAQLGALDRGGRAHARRGLVHAEVRDDGRREVLDELGEPIAITGIDAVELGAAQPAARRDEVDADDLAGPRALLDQLRDARAELAAHPGDQHPFHQACSMLSLLRAQVREQDHLADRRDTGQQHHQPVDADAQAPGGRKAVLERAHVVGVDAMGLGVAGCLERGLRLEPPALLDRDR